jgi:hypothetical protein
LQFHTFLAVGVFAAHVVGQLGLHRFRLVMAVPGLDPGINPAIPASTVPRRMAGSSLAPGLDPGAGHDVVRVLPTKLTHH